MARSKLVVPLVVVVSIFFFLWLFLGALLLLRRPCTAEERRGIQWLLCGNPPPLPVYAAYDIALASVGVLVRALASRKVGALPFFHACSRKGSVRGFLSLLNLVQIIHLHCCAHLEWTCSRMLSAVLTTLPWWMDRQGGWTLVMSGKSSFGEQVDDVAISPKASVPTVLLAHVGHLHALFFGLNLTTALSHFRDDPTVHRIVDIPHFRAYWLMLNLCTGCDVVLQACVDRRWMHPQSHHLLAALSVAPAAACALPVLVENVSVEGASASFLLWYLRQHRCLSNFAMCLLWTECFEVVSLLVNRYNLVE